MSARRQAGGVSPLHILLLVAFLEVAINRVAVPMLRPAKGLPPTWHEWLDYTALFLFYFTGTLAVIVIGVHVVRKLTTPHGIRDVVAHVALAIAAGLAAIPLVIPAPAALSFPLELAFALAVVLMVATAIGRQRDIGAQIGMGVLAIPLLLHTAYAIGVKYVWPEAMFGGPGVNLIKAGVLALTGAALVSPYVFAPRPFARSVTRPGPIVIALSIAAIGAVLARRLYFKVAIAAGNAIGVDLNPTQADPRLALYLLAIATLAWTLASCAIASSMARRQIGLGIGFVILGGYAFEWSHHYLLPLLGMALVADATRRVREEELAALPFETGTPMINDGAWSAYVGNVKTGLARSLDDVHTLTTRGDGGLASTVIVGERAGLTVRTRIERIEGSVVALDIILGREVEEVRSATFTLWAIPSRGLGVNPAAPQAAPQFKTADAPFDERFKARGDRAAFDKMFDDGLRARAVATFDGWLAYWQPDGLRYRVYPGRGAPLDHPLPLSDLALGRPASADRLVAIVELLLELAARGLTVTAPVAPTTLDDMETS